MACGGRRAQVNPASATVIERLAEIARLQTTTQITI
jgi:hypothetical protein